MHVPDAPRPAKFPRPLKPLLRASMSGGSGSFLAHMSVSSAPGGVDRFGLGKKSNGGELSAFILVMGQQPLFALMLLSYPSLEFISPIIFSVALVM